MGLYGSNATPAPRNMGQEYRDTLNADIDLAPRLFASEQQYRPQYTALQTDLANQAGNSLATNYRDNLLPIMNDAENASNLALREGDIGSVEQLGYRAVEAYQKSNPAFYNNMDSMVSDAQNSVNGEGTRISQLLEKQAYNDLQSGRELTDEETRQVEQNTRAGFSSRGLGRSNFAVGQEIFDKYNAGNQRYRERQNVAMQVDNRKLNDRAYLQSALAMQGNYAVDPMMAVLGRSGRSPQMASQQQGLGSGFSTAGNTLFNPQNAYASNLHSNNYKGQWSAYNARENHKANMRSAVLGLAKAGIGAL